MLIRRKSIEKEESRRPRRERSLPLGVQRRTPRYAPITLSEMDGVRYLHFGSEWVQGAMRISQPDALELEYAQQMMSWMLFLPQPRHIVQLGLGTGALTKFCYRHFPDAAVTAVDLNPEVIQVSHSMFNLPQPDGRLAVLEMDALDYVSDARQRSRRPRIDVLQVDLYDSTARGPILDTPEFYAACARSMSGDGILTVNLFGDHPSYEKNLAAMGPAFACVLCLPPVHQGNVVALAFKSMPTFDWAALSHQAAALSLVSGMPTGNWVPGLQAAWKDWATLYA